MLIEHPQGFYFDLTYVWQKGDYADDNIDAYGYHVLLGYRNKDILLKPSVSVEYSYASGDDDPNDSIRKTFDAAFGARDSMYGRMIFFNG